MVKVVVVAPHADDESLGCGGALLKHIAAGDTVHWLLLTQPTEVVGYSEDDIARRKLLIDKVCHRYSFQGLCQLDFAAAMMDKYPAADLVAAISGYFSEVRPQVVYLPFWGDAHSDHRIAFDAAFSCTKWFRHPYIRSVRAYETPSETDICSKPGGPVFQPNLFVDITSQLQEKLSILELYAAEMRQFPFPRSAETITSLARVRGSQCGAEAAESFMLLREMQ